jgi:hypothetical protein
LALGADGTYLKSNGADAAPTFAAISVGGGNVSQSAAVTADNITSWSADNVVKDGGVTVASIALSSTVESNYFNKSVAISGNNITNLTWTKIDNAPNFGYGNGTSNYTSANFTVDLASSGANSKGFTYYNITNTSDFNFDISAGSKNITAVYMLCNGGTNVTGVLEKHDINGTFKAAVNASAWVAVNNTGLWITSFGNATMVANETLYWNSTSVNGAPTFFTLKVYYGN